MQEQVNNLSRMLPVSNNGKPWVFWDENVHLLVSFYLLISVCACVYLYLSIYRYTHIYTHMHTHPHANISFIYNSSEENT